MTPSRFFILLVLLAVTGQCPGQESQDSDQWRIFREHLKLNVQALTFMTENGMIDSSLLNPGNRLAALPAANGTLELRPDFRWTGRKFTLIAKPRFGGVINAGGTQSSSTAIFMQEWALRVTPVRGLTLSYGREVLQWGPSMSISPSNPFFLENGRDNPIREIGGADFVRAIYSPNTKYSVSYIWNTGAGRSQQAAVAFRRTQALKFDYTPSFGSASFIFSKKDGAPPRFGGFFQITASNALLLYAEGVVHRGSEALYPYQDATGATWQMAPVKNDSDHIYSTSVVGAAYTLRSGATLTAEYISNRDGYSNLEANRYFQLGEANSQLLTSGRSQSETAAATLTAALNPGLPLLRRNYFSVQFLRTNYHQRADLMIRYTANLDDGGGTLAAYATFNCTDRIQLFLAGMVDHGGSRTEAGRLIGHQVMTGIRFFLK